MYREGGEMGSPKALAWIYLLGRIRGDLEAAPLQKQGALRKRPPLKRGGMGTSN